MKKEENIVYQYYPTERQAYINLTNRCSNACEFCIRNGREGVRGSQPLWLEHEPDAEEVKSALAAFPNFDKVEEFVFCGFGEPIYRVEVVREIGGYLKSAGKRTRINTNGQGNLIHGRDVTPLLSGAVDVVSISLNASTPEKYQSVCRCKYGEQGYYAMLDFAKRCAAIGLSVVLSVVDTIGPEEIEACRKIAEECNAAFRVRKFE